MLAAPPVPPTPPTFHHAAPAIPQPVLGKKKLQCALFDIEVRVTNISSVDILEQQQQLLQQVMALTPADIASLPEDQRVNILQLRAQLMGTS